MFSVVGPQGSEATELRAGVRGTQLPGEFEPPLLVSLNLVLGVERLHSEMPVCAEKRAIPVENGRKKVVEKDRNILFGNFARGCSAFSGNFCLSLGNMVFDAEGA